MNKGVPDVPEVGATIVPDPVTFRAFVTELNVRFVCATAAVVLDPVAVNTL